MWKTATWIGGQYYSLSQRSSMLGMWTAIVNWHLLGFCGDSDCVGFLTTQRFLNSVYSYRRIWFSHGDGYKEFCQPTFQRNILPPPSPLKNKQTNKSAWGRQHAEFCIMLAFCLACFSTKKVDGPKPQTGLDTKTHWLTDWLTVSCNVTLTLTGDGEL
jgi:hypothetical protein